MHTCWLISNRSTDFLHESPTPTWPTIVFHNRAADLMDVFADRFVGPCLFHYDTAGVIADYLTEHPEDVSGPGAERLPGVIAYLRAVFEQRRRRPVRADGSRY